MHFIPSATVTWKGSKRGLFREYLIIFDDFAFIAPEIDSSLDKLVDPVNQSMVAFHNSIPTPVGLRHCLIIFQILHDISRYSIPKLAIINTLYIIISLYSYMYIIHPYFVLRFTSCCCQDCPGYYFSHASGETCKSPEAWVGLGENLGKV